MFLEDENVPLVLGGLIGDLLENRWSAPNYLVRLFFFTSFVLPANRRCDTIGLPIVMERGASVRQYIGAPMSLCANRQCWPDTVDQKCFFLFGTPGCIGLPWVLADYKRIVFGAPRLFSCLSPINWALHTGNGTTLKKRQRLDKRVNRHWSPQSGTIFEYLPASGPT